MQRLIENRKRRNIKSELLILFLILISSDSVIVGTNAGSIASKIANYSPAVMLIVFMIMLIMRGQKVTLMRRDLILVLVLAVNIFITMLLKDSLSNFDSYLISVLLIVDAALLTQILSFEELTKEFENVMFFLALFSLITYFATMLIPSLFDVFPVIENKAGQLFSNLLFAVVPKTNSQIRNYGVFREPGVFQIYVNLAILFLCTQKEKINIKRLLIYIVTIITTFSTAGFFSLVFLLLCLAFSTYGKQKKLKWVFVVLIITFFVFATSAYSDQLLYIIQKPFLKNDTSGLSRTASIVCNIELWLKSPIIGLGHQTIGSQYPVLASAYAGRLIQHNTNTLLYLLACYGGLFGAILIVGTFKFSIKLTRNSVLSVMLFAFFVLLYMGESLYRSILPYVIMVYGLFGYFVNNISECGGGVEHQWMRTKSWTKKSYKWKDITQQKKN